MNNRYKIYSSDSQGYFELYDLVNDKEETSDIAGDHPEIVRELKELLSVWRASCRNSCAGKDYKNDHAQDTLSSQF